MKITSSHQPNTSFNQELLVKNLPKLSSDFKAYSTKVDTKCVISPKERVASVKAHYRAKGKKTIPAYIAREVFV